MILRSEFPLKLEEFHAMANPSIDPARFLHEHLTAASPLLPGCSHTDRLREAQAGREHDSYAYDRQAVQCRASR